MSDPAFLPPPAAHSVHELAAFISAEVMGSGGDAMVRGLAPLDRAVEGELSVLRGVQDISWLPRTHALACLIAPRFAPEAPETLTLLVCDDPAAAYARLSRMLQPEALRPGTVFGAGGVAPGATVHTEARLEEGVAVDPGAVIGPRAEIGAGSVIGANAVIGPDVRIGRNCAVAPGAVVLNSLIGNRVIVHSGARLGHDGFDFVADGQRYVRPAGAGRVVVQDDVDIGAGAALARGSDRDTIIGEGTKIDDLAEIGQNVFIGRHGLIGAHAVIGHGAHLADRVSIGAQAGVLPSRVVGARAQVAVGSSVWRDVPADSRFAGMPAQPIRRWLRDMISMRRQGRADDARGADQGERE